MRLIILLAVALATSVPAVAAPKFDPPPEIAAHVPRDLRSYFLAFFVTPQVPKEMSRDVFVRHQAYLREQTEKKVYHLFGPLTDGGKTRGIIILTAGSADEARAIVGADAAVQAGVLGVEVHPLVLPNLDGLKIDYPPRQ